MLAHAKSRAENPPVAISMCTPSVIDLIAVPPVKTTGARCNQRIQHRFFQRLRGFTLILACGATETGAWL
jgi:hypothetical protein